MWYFKNLATQIEILGAFRKCRIADPTSVRFNKNPQYLFIYLVVLNFELRALCLLIGALPLEPHL
jgi:hypothetical protein